MVSQYKERRDIIVEKLNEIPGISCKKPKGTFYAFANIKSTGLSSDDHEALRRKAGCSSTGNSIQRF